MDRFFSDVYPVDRVVIRGGKISKPPRYYDKLLLSGNYFPVFSNPYDDVIDARVEKAKLSLDDNTPDRLIVKEQVKLAQLSKLKRVLI